MSLDLLEQANLAQLKTLAEGEVATERVTLPAGEALHLRYNIKSASQPAPPTIDQYLVLMGDRQLMVSVTNASAADAAAIAGSLEKALGADRHRLRRQADPGRRQSSANAACASSVGDQRVGKATSRSSPISAKRASRSTRACPASPHLLVALIQREPQRGGSRPSASQRARTSRIRAAMSSASMNTKFSSSA